LDPPPPFFVVASYTYGGIEITCVTLIQRGLIWAVFLVGVGCRELVYSFNYLQLSTEREKEFRFALNKDKKEERKKRSLPN
jgi:hypothetical protein